MSMFDSMGRLQEVALAGAGGQTSSQRSAGDDALFLLNTKLRRGNMLERTLRFLLAAHLLCAGELDHAEGGIAGFGVAGVLLFVGLEFARGLVARAQALHHDASRAVLDDVYPHELAERLVSSAIRGEQRRAERASVTKREPRHTETSTNRQSTLGRTGALAAAVDDCSVLFTDIVGFTEWSSNVPPDAVFQYLGTLFREFDRQATKYKVYKVETIGDSYMAVCGLPEPTADHAARMADFALAIVEVHAHISQSIGAAMGIRVGIHSGSVTAGVLMGARCRFQLFGVESMGHSMRVHVSDTTAGLLRDKFDLQKRDAIHVKGKGLMHTYWLLRRKAGSARSIEPAPSAAAAAPQRQRSAFLGMGPRTPPRSPPLKIPAQSFRASALPPDIHLWMPDAPAENVSPAVSPRAAGCQAPAASLTGVAVGA